MSDFYKEYSGPHRFKGWLGTDHPELARSAFDLLSEKPFFYPRLRIAGQTRETKGTKAMLYQVVRKVLGKDTPNYAQQIGDCVSFGAKNAAEYLQCSQILAGQRIKWRPVFPPYYYGTGRCYVGKNQISGDGSLGTWMAEAVINYGTLFADEQGVPQYSGSVAKAWGDRNPGPDIDKWVNTAKPYAIRSTVLIRTWDDLVAAIANGYPCTTASDVGYSMEASSDGFHRQTDNWSHQMQWCGVDDNDRDPYGILLNNWGDVHGRLKDFDDGHELPVGVLRVRRRDVEKHLAARETFAFSDMLAFPERDITKEFFDLLGN